jgi:hypothetical protein
MEKVLLIMCIWKRVNNLKKILECLSNQTYKNFKFVIWDNSEEKNLVKEIVSLFDLDIEIIPSEKNIGGIGRFYAAKKHSDTFQKIIFFDDDQFPEEDFIEVMVKSFQQKTIKSRHCYKLLSNIDYWKRQKTPKGVKHANYCGTGGMIIDSEIFKNEDLFKCPKEYSFIEDLWLSYFAQHRLKWQLESIEIPLILIEDGKDQFRELKNKKSQFLKYLIEKEKWDINKIY